MDTCDQRIPKKWSEVVLNRAVMYIYYQHIATILNFADKKIGPFIPRRQVFLIIFSIFILLHFSVGLMQVLQYDVPFAKRAILHLIIFPSVSTIIASFCYTVTYFVLYLIRNGKGIFLPRYLYLVTFELLISYILAPLAYLVPSLYAFENGLQIFAILILSASMLKVT